MNQNEIIATGVVEEIKDYLPEVVYNDLISRASEPEIPVVVDTPPAAPQNEPAPAAADVEDSDEVKTYKQAIEDLKFLIELGGSPEDMERFEQEIQDLQYLIDLEKQ